MASKRKLPATKENIAAGKKIYDRRCFFCHGAEGAGDGPVADYLDPRPRDFTVGIYKFRATRSGELPTDEDLFRTISRGIPGTAMPEWEPYLSEEERWQVIHYVKTFFPEFSLPELNPYKKLVKISDNNSTTQESINKGKEIFKEAKCWECHGQEGRGDGKKISELKDAWDLPIRPFDLTKGWRFKGGSTPMDIYLRFTTGINGTPMPSFIDSLSDEERWHLANYIAFLDEGSASEEVVLKAKFIKEEILLNPDDLIWKDLPALRIPLIGQIIAKPRWQNHSVDMVKIKSLYNEKEVAFYLEWDDPTEDTIHQEDREVYPKLMDDTYVKPSDLPREPGVFRDSIALQFPVKILDGPEKSHFFRGDSRNPVNLWIWKADGQKGDINRSVEEANAKGFEKPLLPQPLENQQTKGKGVWKDGRWMLVIKRARFTNDKSDVQFHKGRELIPFTLNAWDGTNGEHGLIMSLSSWNYIYLETSVSLMAYPSALFGALLIGGLEVLLIKISRKN